MKTSNGITTSSAWTVSQSAKWLSGSLNRSRMDNNMYVYIHVKQHATSEQASCKLSGLHIRIQESHGVHVGKNFTTTAVHVTALEWLLSQRLNRGHPPHQNRSSPACLC